MIGFQNILDETRNYMIEKFSKETSGHDFFHIQRVVGLSKYIQKKEGGDPLVVEMGAWLHDIADYKFHDGDEYAGVNATRTWLETFDLPEEIIDQIAHIVLHVSYKGQGQTNGMESLEGKIVQDSDRLDAMGAIGIARTFIYGGRQGFPIYDPAIAPVFHASFDSYKRGNAPIINHFHEKLLLLKSLMNTETGKKLAKNRHDFMLNYLDEFHREWQQGMDH
jgi:uncharacterized protein